MWFTLSGVAGPLRGEQDPRTRLLLLSMLEQGLCDHAAANAPADADAFPSIVGQLRALTLAHAAAVLDVAPAPEEWMTAADAAAGVRFTGVRPSGFPEGFGRRKFWVAVPETLSVHHDGLEAVLDAVRRHAAETPAAPDVVLGIRSGGSLLAPLVAALYRIPSYATLRPLIDKRQPPDDDCCVALDAHTRRLLESCRGEVRVVDDPVDSGRTRDAALRFLARAAPQCRVSFVTIGELDRALGEYDRQVHVHGTLTPLPTRRAPAGHHRTAWHHRDRGRVYKAYGDHRLARLECRTLRDFAPALDYRAEAQFVSSRFLGDPQRTTPTRAQVIALGESMARYRETFAVEPVPPDVWAAVTRRRGQRRTGFSPSLVRSNGKHAWWHYRWNGAAVDRVSAELGHWSSVVDMAELLESAVTELGLDAESSRLLADVYASNTGMHR